MSPPKTTSSDNILVSDFTSAPTKAWHETTWKEEFAQLVRDPQQLAELLELNALDQQHLLEACQSFALRVPRPYLSRIKKGILNDPLLLQVLPQHQELTEQKDFSPNPLQENDFTPVEGLLHKYKSRVLLILNGNCAIHCRYCFRRHFPYQEHRIDTQQWQKIIDYIKSDSSIEEVILSGGDPLSSSDESLKKQLKSLSDIAHLKRLRIHTRLPIMIPQRITDQLVSVLSTTRLDCVVVIHCNHAQEIDAHVERVLLKLDNAGITLLNQSVLLKDINDDAETLAELSKRLFKCKTLPYYLHLLDKVDGAAHFLVEKEQALKIYKKLQTLTSGYLVPKLAIEEPHQKNKTLLS